MMQRENTNNRIIYLDLLRIVSCFAVIVLHTAAQNWYTQSPSSFSWQVFNIYDSLSRFCVPVLVMISGIFFLDKNKEIPIKKLYVKYILRLATAYIFWSIFYAIYQFIVSGETLTFSNTKIILKTAIASTFHLWFLPMLIGVYMLVPFLKLLVKHGERNILKYFIILFIAFGIIIPTIALFKFPFSNYINSILSRIPVDLVCRYVGYFVLGYYIFTYDISKKMRIAAYVSGLLSIIACILITYYYSVSAEKANPILYGYFTITTFFVSTALVVFFKYVVSMIKWTERYASIINMISLCTFGIYLIHVFFLWLFNRLGFNTMTLNAVCSVPAVALAVFAASLITIFVLRKIPKINTFIM